MANSPRLLAVALFVAAAILALSFSQGVVEGRKVEVMRAVGRYGRWRSPLPGARLMLMQQQQEEEDGVMVSTVMDYSEPKANTNPHTGVPSSPDPTSPPAH